MSPPEINSARMYSGPGPGPMLAAATAWDGLAADLHATATSYSSVISGLTGGWLGPASASMAAAAAPYAAWMHTTAAQAEHAGAQAKAAAAAFEGAFAATVPPPVIAANRSLLTSLVATNFLGQNTPAIAATEAHYMQMWAQDVAAMSGYAGASATASQLTPFTPPLHTANPAGPALQAAAVAQAVGTPAGTHAQTIMAAGPHLMAAVPQALQGLAQPLPAADPSPISGLQSIISTLSPLTAIPSTTSSEASTSSTIASSGSWATALRNINLQEQREVSEAAQGIIRGGVPGAPFLPPSPLPLPGSAGMGGFGAGATPPVSAGMGQATSIGPLSVPPGWATAAPEIRLVARALSATSISAAPETLTGGPGSMFSEMALAGMAGRAIGSTGAIGRGQSLSATTRERSEPPRRSPGGPVTGIAAELRELAELRNSGILTDEEFNEQKRRLLSA